MALIPLAKHEMIRKFYKSCGAKIRSDISLQLGSPVSIKKGSIKMMIPPFSFFIFRIKTRVLL